MNSKTINNDSKYFNFNSTKSDKLQVKIKIC